MVNKSKKLSKRTFFIVFLLILGFFLPRFLTPEQKAIQAQEPKLEIIFKRDRNSKTYDLGNGKYAWYGTIGSLHYQDGAGQWQEIDTTPQRVNNAQLDGWLVTQNGWHFALGKPGDKDDDGWVGFGGRQGANWLKFRLDKVGYLHWPTRDWQNIGGAPTYDRAKLTQNTNSMTIGPEGAESGINTVGYAEWADLWQTPGDGAISVQWRVDGEKFKEEVTINQAAREWITANRPPDTTPSETYFGFVYEIDISDIPKWVKNGVLQNIDADFDDDDGTAKIELRDGMDRLLAFLPISYAYSQEDENGHRERITLRKRFWKAPNGKHYLLVGAIVPDLANLPSGDITFDPSFYSSDDPTEDGDIEEYLGDYTKDSANDRMVFGQNISYVKMRAYVEWDISGIPDDASITNVMFKYHCWGSYWGCELPNIMGLTTYQPSARTGEQLWGDIGSGSTLVSGWDGPVVGTGQEQDLGTTADSEVEGQLSDNWYAIGFMNIIAEDYCPGDVASIYTEEKDPAAEPPPTLYVEYTEGGGNTAPTNDSLTFTNPYGGDGNDAVADDATEWNFQAVVSDTDGYTDLTTVVLKLANSSDNETPYESLKFKWTQSTDTFSEEADTQNAATITSTDSDSSCAGNTCTLDFKIQFNTNFSTMSTNYNAELYTTDDSVATDEDFYTDFYQVVPISISISSPADVSLGTITGTGTSSTGEATWTVTTNNPSGYKLEWQASSATMDNEYSDTIAAYTPGVVNTPETWSVAADASEWGGRLKSTSTDYDSGIWGTDDSANAKWLNVKNSALFQIASRASATTGSNEIVQFKAQVGSSKFQPTGVYTVNVTVTATTL